MLVMKTVHQFFQTVPQTRRAIPICLTKPNLTGKAVQKRGTRAKSSAGPAKGRLWFFAHVPLSSTDERVPIQQSLERVKTIIAQPEMSSFSQNSTYRIKYCRVLGKETSRMLKTTHICALLHFAHETKVHTIFREILTHFCQKIL